MARGHVLGNRGVPALAAAAHMRRNALALEEDLDGARGEVDLDLLAGKAIRHRVEMPVDIDVVVHGNASATSFRKHVRFGRQRLELWSIDFLEQSPAGRPEPTDHAHLVEIVQHLADRLVQLRQAAEGPLAQSTEQPTLDDQYRPLDFGLVAGTARTGRQQSHVVVRRHLDIGPVDQRLEQSRLDHHHLRVVRYQQPRTAADRLQCADMADSQSANPCVHVASA